MTAPCDGAWGRARGEAIDKAGVAKGVASRDTLRGIATRRGPGHVHGYNATLCFLDPVGVREPKPSDSFRC